MEKTDYPRAYGLQACDTRAVVYRSYCQGCRLFSVKQPGSLCGCGVFTRTACPADHNQPAD
jgi:hypothetical protein